MHACYFYKCRLDRDTILGLKLLLFWYAGLSLGFIAARFYGDTLVSFLRQAPYISGSVFDFLCASAFPLLFSACAVAIFSSRLSFPLCLIRGLGMGITFGGMISCYGASSWLMVLLLMFSSVCISPIELWFLWRRLCAGMHGFASDTAIATGLCVGIGIIDFLIIAPFLADIFIL